jgi:hypothetical protein
VRTNPPVRNSVRRTNAYSKLLYVFLTAARRGASSSRGSSSPLSFDSSTDPSFYTSESRGGVQRRQVELKGVEGGD